MKKLIFFLVIVAGGAYYYYHFHGGGRVSPYQIVQRGSEQALIATIGDAKVDFTIGRPFEETFMLFGASGEGDDGSDAWLSGIPLGIASSLLRRYPDFHRCDSPGAKEAQASVVDILIVTDKRDVRKLLRTIAVEFDKRIRNKGERLCAKLSGSAIVLNSLEKGGEVLTAEQFASMILAGAIEQHRVFIERVEMMDCRNVL